MPLSIVPIAFHHTSLTFHMPLYQAVLMGIVQGLAEFAPISSSAHLVLLPWLFGPLLGSKGWISDPGQAFDASLHIGTAVALIVFFWTEWKQIFSAWFGSLAGKDGWENLNVRLGWLIIIASIPAAIIGKAFERSFERMFDVDKHPWAPGAIAAQLIVMGLVLWAADRWFHRERKIEEIRKGDAFIVGCSQVLALFPGVSRSGATITAGLFLGFNRETAARFSFLMAMPVTLGAGMLKVMELRKTTEAHPQISALVVGVIMSAIMGYAVIAWMLSYLRRQNMSIFAIYRVVFGLIVLVIWGMRYTGH